MRFGKLAGTLFAFAAAALTPLFTYAEDYPSRPIKIVVGFGAGGSTDAIARFYGQKMSEVLKTPVIIENKPGAKQMVAIRYVMAAKPDGYTLYLGSGSSLSQLPGVAKDLEYDPLKSFTPIALVATVPGVIVIKPSLAVTSLQDLVAYSQADPTRLTYASSGVGSASHLQAEYLKTVTGLKARHIPYKSDADIMRELISGTVDMGFSPVQGAESYIAAGKVKALVVTGRQRIKRLPNVPSLAESGVKGVEGIDPYTYYGLVGPTNTPAVAIAKINDAVNAVSKMPGVVKQLQEMLYADPGTGSAEAFRTYMSEDIAKWRGIAKFVTVGE